MRRIGANIGRRIIRLNLPPVGLAGVILSAQVLSKLPVGHGRNVTFIPNDTVFNWDLIERVKLKQIAIRKIANANTNFER